MISGAANRNVSTASPARSCAHRKSEPAVRKFRHRCRSTNSSSRGRVGCCRSPGKTRSKSHPHLRKSQPRYHRSQQYSITALTDSSGNITERYAYTAYGSPTITDSAGSTLTTSADNNRYTYTGLEWDQTLKLYHYRARMYDSVGDGSCQGIQLDMRMEHHSTHIPGVDQRTHSIRLAILLLAFFHCPDSLWKARG